jgi:hypothetical protein
MQLDTLADVKMTGRALVSGWLDNTPEKRQRAVDSLLQVVEGHDDEMRVKAFDALVRADAVDIKRQELELKRQAIEDERKLRLLELAKSLPTGELIRITSEHKAAAEG